MFLDSYFPDRLDALATDCDFTDGYQDYLIQLGYRVLTGKPWTISVARQEEVSRQYIEAMRHIGDPLRMYRAQLETRLLFPNAIQTSPSLIAYSNALSLKVALHLFDLWALLVANAQFLSCINPEHHQLISELEELNENLLQNIEKHTAIFKTQPELLRIQRLPTYPELHVLPGVGYKQALEDYLNKAVKLVEPYKSRKPWWLLELGI